MQVERAAEVMLMIEPWPLAGSRKEDLIAQQVFDSGLGSADGATAVALHNTQEAKIVDACSNRHHEVSSARAFSCWSCSEGCILLKWLQSASMGAGHAKRKRHVSARRAGSNS